MPEGAKKSVPVSVIIPCWNCADTIRRAIYSVADQTELPKEVILINDKSSDNTLKILYEISDEFEKDWIKIINFENNLGPGLARNAGWDIAKYTYIAFLDADDAWHKDKIKIQYEWMIQNKGVDFSGSFSSYEKEKNISHMSLKASDLKVKKLTLRKMLFSNQIHTRTVMIKKEILLRFRDKSYAEDFLLWLELLGNKHIGYSFNLKLAYIFNLEFSSGYSGNLYKWEKKELKSIKLIKKLNHINFIEYLIFTTWSFIKFLRRLSYRKFKK